MPLRQNAEEKDEGRAKILDDFITVDVPIRQTVAELRPKID